MSQSRPISDKFKLKRLNSNKINLRSYVCVYFNAIIDIISANDIEKGKNMKNSISIRFFKRIQRIKTKISAQKNMNKILRGNYGENHIEYLIYVKFNK